MNCEDINGVFKSFFQIIIFCFFFLFIGGEPNKPIMTSFDETNDSREKLLLVDVKKQEEEEEEEEEEGEELSSPRGVLETALLGSDSDQSISNISTITSSTSSFCSVDEKSSFCSVDEKSSFCSVDEKSSPSVNEKLDASDDENLNSSVDEKSSPEQSILLGVDNYGLQLWNFFDGIKKKSVKQFCTTIPFFGGKENSKKSSKKKGGKHHHSCQESIDLGELVAAKPSWKSFTYKELVEATDNFSSDKMIGKGGHAEVYKGHLSDGRVVAVKKLLKHLEKKNEDRVGDFLSELGIIAHINHPNVSSLIGFSIDRGSYLVLEFARHGSLTNVLHGSDASLEWKKRFKVALGVAEGLNYLHSNSQRRIIHRDITASNILLTEDYEPQISDFGLAKWLPEKWAHHVVSPIEGTFGYMAPEYFMDGIIHEKTDVFAFGVLLLEIITGRHAVDSSQQSLVMWAKPLLESNNAKELADPRLGDNFDILEMRRAMFAAAACLHHLPSTRPSMDKVVQMMKAEKIPVEMRQTSMGGKAVLVEACDLEGYTCATYITDLSRHMELVME
ncbi:hypothetical protein LguiA_005378 [Lonicera macranthoides]